MKLSTTLIGLLGLSSLESCCFDPCVPMTSIAATSFRFSTDTLTTKGFRQEEVRSVYVVVYDDNRLTQPKDTLRLPPAHQPQLVLFEKRRIQLYFSGDSTQGVPKYYRVVVPAAKRQFDVQRVALTWTDSKQCRVTCRDVTGVSFTLNNQPIIVSTAYNGEEAIELSK